MTYDHPLPDTARTPHHNHITRDNYHSQQPPVAAGPETLPSSGESFTLTMKISDGAANTNDSVEIRVSGYSSPKHAIRALYMLNRDGYLPSLYSALSGTYEGHELDEADTDDDD